MSTIAEIQARHNNPNKNRHGKLIFSEDLHQAHNDRGILLTQLDELQKSSDLFEMATNNLQIALVESERREEAAEKDSDWRKGAHIEGLISDKETLGAVLEQVQADFGKQKLRAEKAEKVIADVGELPEKWLRREQDYPTAKQCANELQTILNRSKT